MKKMIFSTTAIAIVSVLLGLYQNFSNLSLSEQDEAATHLKRLSLEQQLEFGMVDLGSVTIKGLRLQECSTGIDNSEFIQAVIDSQVNGSSANRTLLLPAGRSYCTSTLTIASNGVSFEGGGRGASRPHLKLKVGSTVLFRIRNAGNVSIANLKLSAENPNIKSVMFDMHSVTHSVVGRIATDAINTFAVIQNTNNIAFEEIDIAEARGSRVFDLAPDTSSLEMKSDVLSLVQVRGRKLVGGGLWVNLGAIHSQNYHNIEFVGGKHAFYAAPGHGVSFRYFSGHGIRLKDQSSDAVRLESGLGFQVGNIMVSGCGGSALHIRNGVKEPKNALPEFHGQIYDAELSNCKGVAIRLANTSQINIINPKIVASPLGSAVIEVEGRVSEVNVRGGFIANKSQPVNMGGCSNCVNVAGLKESLSAWRPYIYDYSQDVDAIFSRKDAFARGNKVFLSGSDDVGLQNAVDSLCRTGGQLIVGRKGIKLSRTVKVRSDCLPIDITGASRFVNAGLSLLNRQASLVFQGRGHSLRNLQVAGTGEEGQVGLSLSDINGALIDRVTFINMDKAMDVKTAANTTSYYNRFMNPSGSVGSLYMAEQMGDINGVRMMLDTGLCDWEKRESCKRYSGVRVVGGVQNLTAIQTAYIRGGFGTNIAALNSSARPTGIRLFGMGTDHPKVAGARLDGANRVRVDFSWLGQAGYAGILITGGEPDDKYYMHGNLFHGNRSIDTREFRGRILMRGNILRRGPGYFNANVVQYATIWDDVEER